MLVENILLNLKVTKHKVKVKVTQIERNLYSKKVHEVKYNTSYWITTHLIVWSHIMSRMIRINFEVTRSKVMVKVTKIDLR